jgi:hypothetical protein
MKYRPAHAMYAKTFLAVNQAFAIEHVGGRKYNQIRKAPHEVVRWGSRAENVPKQPNQ